MAKITNLVNVIDIEATCWDTEAENKANQSEIIEVGWAVVNVKEAEIVSKGSWLIKTERSTISLFCTKLTTITQEMVDSSGNTFGDILKKMHKDLATKERAWVSWGDYDRNHFDRCCKAAGERFPFGTRHLNLKSLFTMLYHLDTEPGMDAALKILGLNLKGVHHRGGDDAENIAEIYCSILRKFRKK